MIYNHTEFMKNTAANVLAEVYEERMRQDQKWGQQEHQPPLWLSILGEEYGEVCKAVCEAHFTGYAATGNWSQYRKELIQVAAVAVAMVECLDRNTREVIRPIATITWTTPERITIKKLREKRRELGIFSGYVLVIVNPRALWNSETCEWVIPSFVKKSPSWSIITDDNVVGAAENFLFAYE